MKKFKDHLEESLRKPEALHLLRSSKYATIVADDKDWKVIGRGVAGSAYHRKGDNFVVKIFHSMDTGYKFWLKFCIANQNNSFVPKIIGKPIPINSELAAVRLELLESMSSSATSTWLLLYRWWVRYKDSVNSRHYSDLFHQYRQSFSLPDQKMQDFIKVMGFIDNQTSPDLHTGNVMMRPNGQIVITDPLIISKEIKPSKYSKEIETFLQSRFTVE